MAKPVNIYDAKTRLSELVDRAQNGEEIVIAKAGRPVARLIALREAPVERRPGRLRGRIWMAPDFDEPLPEDVFPGFDDDHLDKP
jgi:prevent-host-death family protein